MSIEWDSLILGGNN